MIAFIVVVFVLSGVIALWLALSRDHQPRPRRERTTSPQPVPDNTPWWLLGLAVGSHTQPNPDDPSGKGVHPPTDCASDPAHQHHDAGDCSDAGDAGSCDSGGCDGGSSGE